MIAEYDNGAAPHSPSREYIYPGGPEGSGLLAKIDSSGTRMDWTQRSASVLLIGLFNSVMGLRSPFPRPRIHPYQGRPARLRADTSCPFLIIFRDPELRASRASRGSTW